VLLERRHVHLDGLHRLERSKGRLAAHDHARAARGRLGDVDDEPLGRARQKRERWEDDHEALALVEAAHLLHSGVVRRALAHVPEEPVLVRRLIAEARLNQLDDGHERSVLRELHELCREAPLDELPVELLVG